MTQQTEHSLVLAARAGDRVAFAELYRQTVPIMLALARRLVGQQDAEDLVQEAYAHALNSIATFRSECRLLTWLSAILRHEAANTRRGNGTMLPLSAVALEAPIRDITAHIDLRRGLKALPKEQSALVCRALEGYSCAEMAREVGVSPATSTIRARLYACRRNMQFALGPGKVKSYGAVRRTSGCLRATATPSLPSD